MTNTTCAQQNCIELNGFMDMKIKMKMSDKIEEENYEKVKKRLSRGKGLNEEKKKRNISI